MVAFGSMPGAGVSPDSLEPVEKLTNHGRGSALYQAMARFDVDDTAWRANAGKGKRVGLLSDIPSSEVKSLLVTAKGDTPL